MARKDKIFLSFVTHPILVEKYGIAGNLPSTVREAKDSSDPIIAAIARIVEAAESSENNSEASLYKLINQYLNTCAL